MIENTERILRMCNGFDDTVTLRLTNSFGVNKVDKKDINTRGVTFQPRDAGQKNISLQFLKCYFIFRSFL